MKRRPLCLWCLLFISIRIALYLYAPWGTCTQEPPPQGTAITVTGYLTDKAESTEYQLLTVTSISCTNPERSFPVSKFLIYDRQFQKAAIGDTISIQGTVAWFDVDRNPGNFNLRAYYRTRKIAFKLLPTSPLTVVRKGTGWRETLYQRKRQGVQLLKQQTGVKYGGILATMILGAKTELEPDVREQYQKNGIAHVLAISGLHISLLGMGFYRVLRKSGRGIVTASLWTLLFLGAYLMLVGPQVSVLRACIMFLLRMGAQLVGRVYDRLISLAVSGTVILLWNPAYLWDSGFWLSFLAVGGMVFVVPLWQDLYCLEKGRLSRLTSGLSVPLSLQLTLLPVLLYTCYEVPLYAFFLNLIVVPFMAVLLPLGILGMVCVGGNVPLVGQGIFEICRGILWGYEALCRGAQWLPAHRLIVGKPEKWQLVLYSGLLLLGLFRYRSFLSHTDNIRWQIRYGEPGEEARRQYGRYRRSQQRKIAGILAVGLLLVTMQKYLPTAVQRGMQEKGKGVLQVTMLDVGQGDGIYIRTPGGIHCLIDGGSSTVGKLAQYRLEPYLESRGVDALDYVFLSHGDSDHINGIAQMLERQRVGVKIRCLVLPHPKVWDDALRELAQKAKQQGCRVAVMKPGDKVQEGTCALTCLYPGSGELQQGEAGDGELREPGNESSMVLSLSYGFFSMLFTGDLELEGEVQLTEELAAGAVPPRYTVLKVAHHGSKNATSEAFLEQVRPTYALVSAGKNNRYGHPHGDTLARLQEAGCQIETTMNTGAITLLTDGENLAVTTHLRYTVKHEKSE